MEAGISTLMAGVLVLLPIVAVVRAPAVAITSGRPTPSRAVPTKAEVSESRHGDRSEPVIVRTMGRYPPIGGQGFTAAVIGCVGLVIAGVALVALTRADVRALGASLLTLGLLGLFT